MSTASFYSIPEAGLEPLQSLPVEQRGKVYADIPLGFFGKTDDLKKYIIELKEIGVNVALILPHFLPSLSPYVVKNYEKPCHLFADWHDFAALMKFIAEQGMDRMIDIPFNHADWQADNLKREWFKDHAENGIEAGADDVDADNNRVRVNWGAFVLDNSLVELQDYWLEKVIFPHLQNYNVNAIRIDAAWGLDPEGLKRIVGKTKEKYPQAWFLAENLGMAPLIKLAESGIAAGADRFFNNIYWYSGGLYIPTDIYTLYKRSGGVPTCTIYSSHDVLMPAMKALARLRPQEVKGLNDKAVVRKFIKYDGIHSLQQLDKDTVAAIVTLMQTEFALSALMSSDVMFAAGSEKCLFERIDVCSSGPDNFALGIASELPEFMKKIIDIKNSLPLFNGEGVVVPFGNWKPDQTGLKGFVKTCDNGDLAMVAVNSDRQQTLPLKLPARICAANELRLISPQGSLAVSSLNDELMLQPGMIAIVSGKRRRK